MNNRNAKLKIVALALEEEIIDLQNKVNDKKVLLEALGDLCDHPQTSKHRGKLWGTCEFCRKHFNLRQ